MSTNSKYQGIIENSATAAAALGIPGAVAPGLDIAGIAGIWSNLLIGIARRSGKELDAETTLKFATGVAGGVAGYLAGCRVFTYLLNFIPGGVILNIGFNGVLNYIFTKRFGRAVGSLFDKSSFGAADLADVSVIVAAIIGVPGIVEIRDAISSISPV